MEMMAKIRYYLLSDVKSELNHFTNEETESELKILVQECGFFNDEDDENNENDDFFNNYDEEPLEIPSHDVQVLIINNIVDMNHAVFTGEFEGGEVLHNDTNSDNDDEDLEEEEFSLQNLTVFFGFF